jgi:hypothetical protein
MLPQVIATGEDGAFALYTPPVTASYEEAEQSLRTLLGIGADIRVPLAAD